MDISQGLVCDELYSEMIQKKLSEQEADAIQIIMMHHGGNPKPEFYNKLWKEDWFNSTDATVEDYLRTELQKRYGSHASFEIYFGKEQGEERVEYVDGVKQ